DVDGREAFDDGPARKGGAPVGDGEEPEVPMRSREALVLARNFQRIKDPGARMALKAFFEACAGISPAEEAGVQEEEGAMPPLPARHREEGSDPRKRIRRPRGAVWHPSDIERS
ncbi:MAG TPA: hypothetical protein VEB64_15035, partial [Azospirillaceae bacterium]|nr:hypothetical protein [Azospirillaceae bacterium]